MTSYLRSLSFILLLMTSAFMGCSQTNHASEHQEGKSHKEHKGEHNRDQGGDSEGEEAGTELALHQSYNNVRNGARLILTYNKNKNAFEGTVENTTAKTLERVRVEVHLSNGKELGPTKPKNLKPGEKSSIILVAQSRNFDRWNAHPEVGNNEHTHGAGHGKEGRGEHSDKEARGEHN